MHPIWERMFMVIGLECRRLAARCVAEARNTEQYRIDLLRLAHAWVKLGREMDRVYLDVKSCSDAQGSNLREQSSR
jgi:hypothetical protein